MDGQEFYACVEKIVGPENAKKYAARLIPLDDQGPRLFNYEALAFYVYTTGLHWHEYINRELWNEAPPPEILVFRDVLNQAIHKLAPYTRNRGIVYRGYRAKDLNHFVANYEPGSIITFPGFTSASIKQETAFGGNVLFTMRTHNAKPIWFVAADYKEDEVLMPTGASFLVLAVNRDEVRAVISLEQQN